MRTVFPRFILTEKLIYTNKTGDMYCIFAQRNLDLNSPVNKLNVFRKPVG